MAWTMKMRATSQDHFTLVKLITVQRSFSAVVFIWQLFPLFWRKLTFLETFLFFIPTHGSFLFPVLKLNIRDGQVFPFEFTMTGVPRQTNKLQQQGKKWKVKSGSNCNVTARVFAIRGWQNNGKPYNAN